jgi:hypothetical protein
MTKEAEFTASLEELGFSHDDAETFGALLARIEREKGARAAQQISILVSKYFGRDGSRDRDAFEAECAALVPKTMD